MVDFQTYLSTVEGRHSKATVSSNCSKTDPEYVIIFGHCEAIVAISVKSESKFSLNITPIHQVHHAWRTGVRGRAIRVISEYFVGLFASVV